MEKVISITGKGYAYRDEEPIKGRNTAPCEERNFPDNEMGEDEEISFLKELLEQEESIRKECTVSQKIRQKHRKCSVSAPHYDTNAISMQALERFAEQIGEKEKELLAILAIYAVTEYEEGELSVILNLLSRGESEISDTLLCLSDCHPAKKRYLRFITVGGALAQEIDAQAEKLFDRLCFIPVENLAEILREIHFSEDKERS